MIDRPWTFVFLMSLLLAASVAWLVVCPDPPARAAPAALVTSRVYFVLPLTSGMPKILDCKDGEIMADVASRELWVCTHRAWWSVVP